MPITRRSHTKYKVIQVYDCSTDYSIHIQKRQRQVLEKFDTIGMEFTPGEFYEKNKNINGTDNHKKMAKTSLSTAIKMGLQLKILEKIQTDSTIPDWFYDLESVNNFRSQLRKSKNQNLKSKTNRSTNNVYLGLLWDFNRWLVNQKVTVNTIKSIGTNQFEQVQEAITFEHIENLLNILRQPNPDKMAIVKTVKLYLNDTEYHENRSASYMKLIKTSILSYFKKNDYPVDIEFNPNNLYHSSDESLQQQLLTLDDFYKMLTQSKITITQKAVFLCKFHRGLDASTFADRFNFEVFPQLVKWFGTEEYKNWDLKKCPVITEHVRIKTTFAHPGGLDVDAVTAIQDYLSYREMKLTGSPMRIDQPLFLNNNQDPITDRWIFRNFFNLAKQSGILKRLDEINSYNVDSHELRDLLKTTMTFCECQDWASEIAIGHKPDGYNKMKDMFVEKFRSEYAKCSKMINIFSKVQTRLQVEQVPKEIYDKCLEEIDELKQQNKNLSDMVTELREKRSVKPDKATEELIMNILKEKKLL